MQWSKAKTILIIVLVLANAFLFVRVRALYTSRNMLTDEFVESSQAALAKNGVTVSENKIPREKVKLPIMFYEQSGNSYDSFAQRLLADSTFVQTENEYEWVSDAGTFIAFADGKFEYAPVISDANSENVDASKAESLAETFIGLSGLENKNFEVINCEASEKGYTVVVQQYSSSVAINDAQVTLEIQGENIVSAAGKLYIGSPVSTIDGNSTDAVNVLFSVAPSFESGLKVAKMSLCYIPLDSNEGRVALTPMYEIESAEEVYYFDLATNRLIK